MKPHVKEITVKHWHGPWWHVVVCTDERDYTYTLIYPEALAIIRKELIDMKKITDPTFKYVRSTDTDIRKTFARVRKEMKEEKQSKVVQLPLKEKK